MAALRVQRPAHHHRQLRGPRPRGALAEAGQDRTRTEARGYGNVLSRDLLRRGEPQNYCPWLRPPPRLISAQHLEHHGLLRRGDRVRVECLFLSVKSLPLSTSVYPFSTLDSFPNFLPVIFNISYVLGERFPKIVNSFHRHTGVMKDPIN